ncbi:MAG TPA: hypothetical protein VIM55_09165 [Mucilaginibacter sp.]
MKTVKAIFFLTLAGAGAFAQTTTVKGVVNDEKGKPVPYAFVRDVNHNYATFTDSTGTFNIKADPSSSLMFRAASHKDTWQKISSRSEINVVLPEEAKNGSVVSLSGGQNNQLSEFLRRGDQLTSGKGAVTARGGSDVTVVSSGFKQEPTRGSRLYFDDWVPGFGINKTDSIVFEKENVYNFDKIDGTIIYTNDGRTMSSVSTGQLRSFTLYDKKGHAHTYESAPEINKKPFVEVLLSTPKYKIYKRMDTKLVRADYKYNGVTESGNKYDEFVDDNRYIFVVANGEKPQTISLKKSVLKKAFNGDADSFIVAQGSREVDEEYIKDLGRSLSK